MEFKQAEKEFEKLKAQFAAGTLSEAKFKSQLEELMLQDKQGSWWMIGYETEKWYRYDGKDWVQTDPPGTRSIASTAPPPRQEVITDTPRASFDDQGSLWKFGRKEIIRSVIGLGVFTVLFFLSRRSDRSLFYDYWSLAFAVPLFFGVVFGPIVGAIVGAGGYLITTVLGFSQNYGSYFLEYFSITALFAVAIGGFIMGFAKAPSNNFRSFKSLLRVELFILVATLVHLLFSVDLIYLFSALTRTTFPMWSWLAWSLILVPISLIVYSFILSRRQTIT